MDNEEAKALLEETEESLKQRNRSELVELLDKPEVTRRTGQSGKHYAIEVQAMWDSEEGRDLRVMISVDDGGIRAFLPLTKSFLVTSASG